MKHHEINEVPRQRQPRSKPRFFKTDDRDQSTALIATKQVRSFEFRRGAGAISSPSEAVAEMIAAGAVFAVHASDDLLGTRFTFDVAPGGDRERCRAILADARQRSSPFFAAFRAAVLDIVRDRRDQE